MNRRLAKVDEQGLLRQAVMSDNLYRTYSIDAAIDILKGFKSDPRSLDLASHIADLQPILENFACLDGSFVGWVSTLFEVAINGGASHASWQSLLSLGEQLVVPAFVTIDETVVPFRLPQNGCSMHAIGESLIPCSRGSIQARNGNYQRNPLYRIEVKDSFLYVDEISRPIRLLFLDDYEFPNGQRALPLLGPAYYDESHASSLHSVAAGVKLLSRHWEYGELIVKYFGKSLLPVLSPSSMENISVSSANFPGWIVASIDTPLYMAECLVHEASHNLLYALSRDSALFEGKSEALYYSPWRPDPRPVDGLLHACFVFSNVIELYKNIASRADGLGYQSKIRLGAEIMRMLIGLDSLSGCDSLTENGVYILDYLYARVERTSAEHLHILTESDRLQIEEHLSAYRRGMG